MKNPIPLLLVLGLGGLLMKSGSRKQNPSEDELPTSIDYSNPSLHDALDETFDDEDEDE